MVHINIQPSQSVFFLFVFFLQRFDPTEHDGHKKGQRLRFCILEKLTTGVYAGLAEQLKVPPQTLSTIKKKITNSDRFSHRRICNESNLESQEFGYLAQ